jgi:Nucleotidyl transferase AbiEii toxin, Type IV TA system
MIPGEQQFAETLHAYTLPRHGAMNTRVRDLVDMVLLIQSATLARSKITEGIRVTFERRETHLLPDTLPVAPAEWQNPYRALARECDLSGQAEDAFAVLQMFMESILGK